MDWAGTRVFVTGAGGFIGSHLCERLADLGADVTALVRYNSRTSFGFLECAAKDKRRRLAVVLGDIRDEEVFRLHLPAQDVVFHLAAVPGIPYSFEHPRDVVEINTMGSLNLLTAARRQNALRVVLVSSAETYGDARYLPIDEEHCQNPKSPYAASKAAMEKLALSFHFADDVRLNIVRLFNNYGPRQSARAVTPTILTQLLVGDSVTIGSLEPKRDFTFVLDTVDALLKVASLDAYGAVYNVGSGVSLSVGEIVDVACRVLGRSGVETVKDDARVRPGQSEIWSLECENRKLREATGWQPCFTYEEGLRLTIEWIRANLDLYKPERYAR